MGESCDPGFQFSKPGKAVGTTKYPTWHSRNRSNSLSSIRWRGGLGEEARWIPWIAPLLGPPPTPSSWREEENLRKLRKLLCIVATIGETLGIRISFENGEG